VSLLVFGLWHGYSILISDLEAVFSDKYDTSDEACTIPSITRWLGADPGAASSAFGLIVVQFKAINKPNGNIWDLDKTQSSSNDVLDALRLSLLCLRSSN
jgi:hypothetical protein